ncbi:hypothetical protein EVAR_32445_1 [Eumeta japonica]|uniref:Uncharacterized protein n=1 Tax=Eumeta variegata TaxID=151549 RepID=A0A4C1VM84_EUMVA|nr:hypothetical protein EVAR_32445_1 [Eumeta japonica]
MSRSRIGNDDRTKSTPRAPWKSEQRADLNKRPSRPKPVKSISIRPVLGREAHDAGAADASVVKSGPRH